MNAENASFKKKGDMKKAKKPRQKLSLNRETLTQLHHEAMGRAAGGTNGDANACIGPGDDTFGCPHLTDFPCNIPVVTYLWC